jgi:hypothetical protein
MRAVTSFLLILPIVFGALAHFFRESDSVPALFGLWILFSLVCLIWALVASRKSRSLAWTCVLTTVFQFVAFSLLFAFIDARAKTRAGTANHAVSGNGAVAFLSHAQSFGGAVPEQQRWAGQSQNL